MDVFSWIGIGYTTVIGLFLGSFTTMLIHRLHYEEKGIIKGRSRCPHCKNTLGVKNLIPLFSWIFQKGKCSFCHAPISYFYPLVEAVFGIVFFIFAYKFYTTGDFLFIMTAVFLSLVFFFYDVRFFEVDQRLTIPAIIGLLIYMFFRSEPWSFYFIGGIIGFLFYAIQYWISKGTWVGSGDQQLGLFMGLLLGWQFTIGALFLAYILGTIVLIPFLVLKKVNGKTHIPMGAFLMPATLIFLYNGSSIWSWYIQTLGVQNLILF